uniref:Uncharacterized protein n=1 Tax=Rhizophora mucronata TaxID=61149 RepID=A0A2P2IZN8_RHIMU
MRSKMLKGTN